MTNDKTNLDHSSHPLILFDGVCGLCNRYAWFGKLDTCRMPDPAVSQRFRFD